MNPRRVLPTLGAGAGIALGLSIVIAATTDVPFLLPLVVFMLCGPIAALISEAIVSRNPLYPQMKETRSWMGFVVFLTVSVVGSAIFTQFSNLGFWKLFAYTSMVVAIAQAVNGIIIEIEDNSPGGWSRPDTWKRD